MHGRVSQVLLMIVSMCLLSTPAFAGKLITGLTEPYLDATLSSTVAGRIVSINVREGGRVTRGAVILELESTQEALEAARRKLIAMSKAELNLAVSREETLKSEMDATQVLFDTTRSVSKEDLLKKILEYKVAAGELESLRTAEEKEDLEYRIALAQLRERQIVAPFDGIVVKHFLQLGENCNPQQPLVRIVDASRCRFVAHAEESLTRGLKQGMKVILTIGNPGFSVRKLGTVEYVSPVVDPASNLRQIKVLFDNKDGLVNPGVAGTILLE